MATKRLNELTEAVSAASGDLMHLEDVAGFDRYITKENFLAETQSQLDNLKGLNPNNQTGTSYTLQLSDADSGEVWMNNVAANNLVVPLHALTAMPIGTYLIMMEGLGVTTIAAQAGVLLNGIDGGSTDIQAQYTEAYLTKRADDVWIVRGNISAVV